MALYTTLTVYLTALQFFVECLSGFSVYIHGCSYTWPLARAFSCVSTHLLTLAIRTPLLLHPEVLEYVRSEKFSTWVYRCYFGVTALVIAGPMDWSDMMSKALGAVKMLWSGDTGDAAGTDSDSS